MSAFDIIAKTNILHDLTRFSAKEVDKASLYSGQLVGRKDFYWTKKTKTFFEARYTRGRYRRAGELIYWTETLVSRPVWTD